MPLAQVWNQLALFKCWASSRYEYSFIFSVYVTSITKEKNPPKLRTDELVVMETDFFVYPCDTHTHSEYIWWHWMSHKLPDEHQ